MNLKNSGDSTGFEPMTSAMPVQCSNQLSYEVTQLRAGQFVGLMFSREYYHFIDQNFIDALFLKMTPNIPNCVDGICLSQANYIKIVVKTRQFILHGVVLA